MYTLCIYIYILYTQYYVYDILCMCMLDPETGSCLALKYVSSMHIHGAISWSNMYVDIYIYIL